MPRAGHRACIVITVTYRINTSRTHPTKTLPKPLMYLKNFTRGIHTHTLLEMHSGLSPSGSCPQTWAPPTHTVNCMGGMAPWEPNRKTPKASKQTEENLGEEKGHRRKAAVVLGKPLLSLYYDSFVKRKWVLRKILEILSQGEKAGLHQVVNFLGSHLASGSGLGFQGLLLLRC